MASIIGVTRAQLIQDFGAYRLPEFWSHGGYQLPLVTRISVSGWLPVTTGYQI